MSRPVTEVPPHDPMWDEIRHDAAANAQAEPALAGYMHAFILRHSRLADALSDLLADRLGSPAVPALGLKDLIDEAFQADPYILTAVHADLEAVVTRDPASGGYLAPLLHFKGFHAIQAYRVAHHYWTNGRTALARFLQSRVSEVFAVDIHPGARLGKGLMFDHATSVVIGETAVVDDDFSMLHEVTLGGTGKEGGDRHPKIRRGVMIGAGAKVLGNIVVGEGAKIGAGSVVLHDVEPHTTVGGIPAKPIKLPQGQFPDNTFPALTMDQQFQYPEGAEGTSRTA